MIKLGKTQLIETNILIDILERGGSVCLCRQPDTRLKTNL